MKKILLYALLAANIGLSCASYYLFIQRSKFERMIGQTQPIETIAFKNARIAIIFSKLKQQDKTSIGTYRILIVTDNNPGTPFVAFLNKEYKPTSFLIYRKEEIGERLTDFEGDGIIDGKYRYAH